ncbi:winged helix-turn-helix domain-containing protein [Pseudomonas sp. GOM7]|uniref:winged helix-turn-helix domain-containing protein n=1 Tax=Pseudomonas sp. GOM7 TaxID=2998079 RepID=UPI00227BE072|nr:winged helix-turn-helix domain-containing protein [Pseudomonas sp. GOM7]WAJ38929.1 winged helix-turn-helix domain-containing protein [Pseudomonas sp. GOM7]
MIRLGDAWISLERREAFRDGAPVRLGGRAFDVLAALLAAPGRLLTKAELLQAAWPGVVVEENNLQVQISTLRRQLALDARLLETVPRRGYRLNLEVPVQAERLSLVANAPAPAVEVHVIDDEPAVRTALVRQLRAAGIEARGYASAGEFLDCRPYDRPGCLLLDVRLREGSGFDLQAQLVRCGAPLPIVFMSGVGTGDEGRRRELPDQAGRGGATAGCRWRGHGPRHRAAPAEQRTPGDPGALRQPHAT